jgi:hypothetical protein
MVISVGLTWLEGALGGRRSVREEFLKFYHLRRK